MSQIGDDLGVLVRQEGVEHLVAAVAQADEAEADAVVGAEHAAALRRRSPSQAAAAAFPNCRRVMVCIMVS